MSKCANEAVFKSGRMPSKKALHDAVQGFLTSTKNRFDQPLRGSFTCPWNTMGFESCASSEPPELWHEPPPPDPAGLSQLLQPLPHPETCASFGLIRPSGLRHFCGM